MYRCKLVDEMKGDVIWVVKGHGLPIYLLPRLLQLVSKVNLLELKARKSRGVELSRR